ncbi:MAG: T9SS type A sorting domain-containing protein, partial [Bacteroidota bacterium]
NYVPNVNSPAATVSGLTTANGGNINALTWTVSQANCSAPASVNITAYTPATVSAGSNQTICSGPTVTMSGSFGGGATSATWSTSGTGTFNNNNPNAVYTPSSTDIASGSVMLTYTTNNPGGPCPAINASMLLTLNSVPPNSFITSVTGPTAGACSNDVYQMTANSTVTPGVTYSWTTGTSPSSTVLFSNSQTGPFSAGPFATTGNTVWAQFATLTGGSYYNVCAKSVNSCGSSVAKKCQSVRGIVGTPGTIIGSSVACHSSVISYSCGASGGATIYNWTLAGSPAAITSGQGTTNVTVTYPGAFTTGQLCVNASLACGGSSTSAQRCMTVANAPLVPGAFTAGPSKVCPGAANVLFTVPASNYASGYNWTVPVGTTIVETPPYGTSIHVNFPASYTGAPPVCVYATSACASSPGRCKSVGNNIPGQPGSMAGPVNNACNTTVQYSVAAVTGASSYTWTIPAGGTNLIGQGTNSIQFDLGSSFTTDQVSVTANTTLCTPGTSTPRTITINGKPATPGTITPNPSAICANTTENFSILPVSPLPVYNWTVTIGTITAGQGTNSMNMTWGSGTGNVSVNATNTCGASSNKTQTFTSTCREEESQPALRSHQLTVYPNPAHDKVTVSIVVKEQTSLKLQLTDISGRVILSENFSASTGLNTYDLNLNQFSKGVYLLEVQTAGENWKNKIMVE